MYSCKCVSLNSLTYLLFTPLDSGLAGCPAVSSAVAGVRSGHGQAATARSVRRPVAAAGAADRLPVQLRHRADRVRQHRLAVAGASTARSAGQPHARRLRRHVLVGRHVGVVAGRHLG